MKVLVTGGGGFLGRHIIRRLLERGDEVSALGRSPQVALVAQGVNFYQGDITDLQAVLQACKGCEAVIHTAAKAGIWGCRKDFEDANVTGTRNVLSACKTLGVRYLVHTSTPSVVFNGSAFEGANESLPYGSGFLCDYAETKARAEQEALAAHDPDVLRVCALRPHLIWGVGDPHLLPRVIARAKTGRLRIVGDGKNRVDITHVENAALAHVLALDALKEGRAGGKAYFISQGEPVELWSWINEMLNRVGVAPVTGQISQRAATAVGAVAEWIWKAFRLQGEPPMTRFVAVELAKSHWFDISAASRDLHYHPEVSLEEGMEAFASNWRSQSKAEKVGA